MLDERENAGRDWTVVAHVLRPQGRRGEVLAELHTDFPERLADGRRVYLAAEGFAGAAEEARGMAVLSNWLPVGRNVGRVVLRLEGVDSIEQAEELGGLDVLIPREERAELEDDGEYISDLVGSTVFDGERRVGEVTGVEFAMTADGGRRLEGAAPLLTVESEDGGEVLIPYVQAFVVAVDVEAKRIEMKLPEGLVELNLASAATKDVVR